MGYAEVAGTTHHDKLEKREPSIAKLADGRRFDRCEIFDRSQCLQDARCRALVGYAGVRLTDDWTGSIVQVLEQLGDSA